MPIISRFFGIIIRMFHNEHNPPHFHAEYQGNDALFDCELPTTKRYRVLVVASTDPN